MVRAVNKKPPGVKKKKYRPDQEGTHRGEYDRNRRIILRTQDICGICGQPVDKSLKFPDPMSPTVDHIVPINRGGHPSDIENLQLAHFICNRLKSDKIDNVVSVEDTNKLITNRDLVQSYDWSQYKG